MTTSSERLTRLPQVVSSPASMVVIALGCVGLAGWTFQIGVLQTVFAGRPPMMPITAVTLVVAGLGLLLLAGGKPVRGRVWMGRLAALVTAMVGAVALGEYLVGAERGIDRVLFGEALSRLEIPSPGRPALLTAVNFLLLGTAMGLLDVPRRYAREVVDVFGVTAVMITLLALIGHACGLSAYYSWSFLLPDPGMAAHTLAALLALGAGVLAARPAGGLMEILEGATPGGVMARRLLLAPVLIPMVTGLAQIAGRRAGFYNPGFAGWLFAFLNIFIFTLILWWCARTLHRMDRVRDRAELEVHRMNAELERRVTERTTELSRALETLRENEEQERLVLDTALDAVITIDAAGRVRGWNREAVRMFGWDQKEILGRQLSETIVPPDQREAHERGLRRFLETREGPLLNRRIEVTAMRRNGEEFPVELAITPIELAGGVVFSAFLRDITGRKEAEAEIHKLNATLEQNVQERTAELQAVNHELEAFSYSVSHDLRAPLRHISGFADLLRQESGASLSEGGRRYLEVIAGSARRMGELIDDLLVFSRMARSELKRSRVRLNDLVAGVIQEIGRDIQGRDIQWDIGALPEVAVDRSMLRQVWLNLLSNAVKYTGHRTRAEISIQCRENGNSEYEFSVKDNGAGFDMQYVGKLFGVFQRLHQAEEFEGTGIGLANVQRIVLRHGGRVWAEGQIDAGATFWFTIPMESTKD